MEETNFTFEQEARAEEAVENIRDIVRKVKALINTYQFIDTGINIGLVLGTFAFTNKVIQDRYKPTGLYKLGKWGVSYLMAAEVAKALKGVNYE